MKALLLLLIMSTAAMTSNAQNNVGWQTGGGYNEPRQTYHYDVPRTQNKRPAQHMPVVRGNDYFNLYNGDYNDNPLAFTLGYVNKFWRTNFGTHVWHENFWGEEGKHLHGIQLGATYQPCLPIGVGLHTGAFWEIYISNSPAVKEAGWDNFTEHDLYIPLHAMWRIPLTPTSAISIYGGWGINWAITGSYNDEHEDTYYDRYEGWVHDHWTESETASYGRGDWPRHFNMSAEIGATVRINQVQFSATYSRGLTDHGFYKNEGNYKTIQNKLGLSVSFLLDD